MTTTGQPPEDTLQRAVLDAIAQIRPGHRRPAPGDTFTALGLDSLDRLALAVAVEHVTGLGVEDQVLMDAADVGDLVRRLRLMTVAGPATDHSHGADHHQGHPARQHLRVDPAAGWIEEGAAIGDGTRLWHQAQIRAGAVVGQECTLGKGCYIGEGSEVGDRVKIGNYANVFGARIGDEAMICPGVLLLEDRGPRATTSEGRPKGPQDWTARPVTVGSGATIGAGAVVAPGVSVGAYALVAVGTVVLRDVPAHGLVIGNPGRQIGWVCRCAVTLDEKFSCPSCSRTYQPQGSELIDQSPNPHPS